MNSPLFESFMSSKKPTFQTNQVQFKQTFADKPYKKSRSDKANNKPNSKPNNKVANLSAKLTEGYLQSASKQGTVAVSIKQRAEKSSQKKTGPLSPRAPEKIRKNRAEEMKVYGENACLALFEHRPEAIVRVWATVQMSHQIGHIFSYLAKHKKVYHVVDPQELSLVSGSEHHGGICMLVKKPTPFTLAGYLKISQPQDCLVALDNIGNSYNVGGLMRTCALFGVKGLLVENIDELNSSSALRIAEGGMEDLLALETQTLQQGLQQLRSAGYQIIHLTQQSSALPVAQATFSNKVVFVISENPSADLIESQDSRVKIPATTKLKQGLNIVVATGILLSHWYSS